MRNKSKGAAKVIPTNEPPATSASSNIEESFAVQLRGMSIADNNVSTAKRVDQLVRYVTDGAKRKRTSDLQRSHSNSQGTTRGELMSSAVIARQR